MWLSNKSAIDFDIISSVNNIIIDSDLNFEKIILLDNNKVNFLYESIYKTKEKFNSIDFVYHNSSLNFNSLQERSYGKTFPINYLYSDIIPLRIEQDNKVSLLIFINDDFNESNFSQVLNFSKSFDHLNAVEKIIINYRNYSDLESENSIKDKLIGFGNYKLHENLIVRKFPTDFRNN